MFQILRLNLHSKRDYSAFDIPSLPSHRDQTAEVAQRFARIYERPVVLDVQKLGRSFQSDHGYVAAGLEVLADLGLPVERIAAAEIARRSPVAISIVQPPVAIR